MVYNTDVRYFTLDAYSYVKIEEGRKEREGRRGKERGKVAFAMYNASTLLSLSLSLSTFSLNLNNTTDWFASVAYIQVLHDHAIVYSNDGDVVPPLACQPRVHHCRYPHTPRRYGAKAVGDARHGVQPCEAGRGPWDRE